MSTPGTLETYESAVDSHDPIPEDAASSAQLRDDLSQSTSATATADDHASEQNKPLTSHSPTIAPGLVSTEELERPKVRICGVCDKNESKYKCTRCDLR